jgi:ribosome biogenesis protein MAK21
MTCAILYIVSKILQERRDLKRILFEQPIAIKIEKEEEIEEEYEIEDNQSEIEDVHVIEKIKDEIEENKIILSNVIIGPDSVASETKPDIKMEEIDIKTEMQDTKPYDPFSRNPLYAGATKGLNVEFEALAKHFHPSVALFANQIIQGIINFHFHMFRILISVTDKSLLQESQ